MALDIAMGGSTNTVLHLLAAAQRGRGRLHDGGHRPAVAASVPVLCKVAPAKRRRAHGGRAPRRRHHGDPRRARPRRAAHTARAAPCTPRPWATRSSDWDIAPHAQRRRCATFFCAAPGGVPTQSRVQPGAALGRARPRPRDGRASASPSTRSASDGGLAVLYGQHRARRLHREDRRRRRDRSWKFSGPARVFESQDAAVDGDPRGNEIVAGDVVVIRYEGPKGGPGMQEMLYPTSYLKSKGLGKACALHHRRALLRRHVGAVDRPRLARGGRGRSDRAGRGRRHDRDRHPGAHGAAGGVRRSAGRAPRGDGSEGRRGLAAGQAARRGRSRSRCRPTPR